jgi:hypothetical protein
MSSRSPRDRNVRTLATLHEVPTMKRGERLLRREAESLEAPPAAGVLKPKN